MDPYLWSFRSEPWLERSTLFWVFSDTHVNMLPMSAPPRVSSLHQKYDTAYTMLVALGDGFWSHPFCCYRRKCVPTNKMCIALLTNTLFLTISVLTFSQDLFLRNAAHVVFCQRSRRTSPSVYVYLSSVQWEALVCRGRTWPWLDWNKATQSLIWLGYSWLVYALSYVLKR